MRAGMKKLKSRAGETLMETLVSVLIAALAFAIIATASVTAAKINAKVRAADNSFHYVQNATDGMSDTVVVREGTTKTTKPVTLYTTDNGYIYYTAGGAS